MLKEFGCDTAFIRLPEGSTRINVKINAGEETEINGQGPVITEEAQSALFEQLDAYQVQGDGQKLLENGNWLYADLVIPYTKEKTAAVCERGTFAPEQQLRIYNTDGQFTGIYAWKQEEKRLKPVKMFLGKEQ